MFAVDDAASTVSPVARLTATTVPSIGLPIVAWFIACSAAATSAVAASTACWSAARSAADGEEPPPVRAPLPAPPLPPAPLRDSPPPGAAPLGADGAAFWFPAFPAVAGGAVGAAGAVVVGVVVVGAGVWSARCCNRSSSLFDASTRAFCLSRTAPWASCTADRACWQADTWLLVGGVFGSLPIAAHTLV